MKSLFVLSALCFANVCYAGDYPGEFKLPEVDGKPVEPIARQVYADVCVGANQPVWCAQARNDANLQGSSGGSGDSSSGDGK